MKPILFFIISILKVIIICGILGIPCIIACILLAILGVSKPWSKTTEYFNSLVFDDIMEMNSENW